MRQWRKALLIVLAALALSGLVLAGPRIAALGNRLIAVAIRHWAPKTGVDPVAARTEGAKLGRGRSGTDCVKEGLRRGDQCDALGCEIETGVLLESCLGAADVTPDFCESVPLPSEITKTVGFRVASCQTQPLKDPDRCGRILSALQRYCDKSSPVTP